MVWYRVRVSEFQHAPPKNSKSTPHPLRRQPYSGCEEILREERRRISLGMKFAILIFWGFRFCSVLVWVINDIMAGISFFLV